MLSSETEGRSFACCVRVREDFRAKYRGCGEQLMRFAFDQANDIAERVGCRLLTLDAYPQSAYFSG